MITRRTIQEGGGGGGSSQTSRRSARSRTIIEHHYEKGWYEYPIISANFAKDYAKKYNPEHVTEWPYRSETFMNQETRIGQFRLNKDQTGKLGTETVIPYDLEKHSPFHTNGNWSEIGNKMWSKGLYDGEIRGDSLYFFADYCKSEQTKVGHMRIRFRYYPCEQATIISEQTLSEQGEFTFKPFHLELKGGLKRCLCIKRPKVNAEFSSCGDGELEPEEFFQNAEIPFCNCSENYQISMLAAIVFGTLAMLCFLGFWIDSLTVIPLVNLLEPETYKFPKALMLSVLCALLLLCSVYACINLVFCKPAKGLFLLTVSLILGYLTFIYPLGFVDQDDTL